MGGKKGVVGGGEGEPLEHSGGEREDPVFRTLSEPVMMRLGGGFLQER